MERVVITRGLDNLGHIVTMLLCGCEASVLCYFATLLLCYLVYFYKDIFDCLLFMWACGTCFKTFQFLIKKISLSNHIINNHTIILSPTYHINGQFGQFITFSKGGMVVRLTLGWAGYESGVPSNLLHTGNSTVMLDSLLS